MKNLGLKQLTSTCSLAILMFAGLNISQYSTHSSEINATGTISPRNLKGNVLRGQTVKFDRSITVAVDDLVETVTTSTAPEKLDILFLADNTDSMGDAIANVKSNATSLLDGLNEQYDDLQVGVARYYGDPKESANTYEKSDNQTDFSKTYTYLNVSKTCFSGQGEAYPCYKYQVDYTKGGVEESWVSFQSEAKYQEYGDSFTRNWTGHIYEKIEGELGAENAYQLQSSVNSDLSLAVDAINQWETGSGNDWAEGNFFGLHQAATSGSDINGYGTGDQTNWRSDAKKVIVWFGDAHSHTMTLEQADVINALKAQDISVIAIHTKSTSKSETHGLDFDLQASSIANATDGAFADVYSSELSQTIENLIGQTVTETITTSPGIDLNFASQGDISGLDVTYSCIDDLGCTNVKDGETRQFQMEVTANADAVGTYNFLTVETTTNTQASNEIVTVIAD